jgi:hypothetical protein
MPTRVRVQGSGRVIYLITLLPSYPPTLLPTLCGLLCLRVLCDNDQPSRIRQNSSPLTP